MHPRTAALLSEIALFTEYIVEYTDKLDFEGYMQRSLVRHGVERNLHTLGEAAVRLRDTDAQMFARLHDSAKLVGLRNRLAHGYLEDIDEEIIWETATVSIPRLLGQVRTLLDHGDVM